MIESLAIVWDFDPVLISIGGFEIRYYSLMWVLALLAAGWVGGYCIRRDGQPDSAVDTAFLYIVLGTIIGARVGHCLFYEPEVYLPEPWRIITDIRKGGLASHGATIGIIVGIWLSSIKNKVTFLWTADRIAIVAPLSGALIRIGNLFNSEIIGDVTTAPWGFKFMRLYPNLSEDMVPACHPTQLYEAICYFAVFVTLFLLYRYTKVARREGFLFGATLVGIFTPRFFIEFIKINQVAFEEGMQFNMGQWLSVPFILLGAGMMIWAWYYNNKGESKVVAAKPNPTNGHSKNKRHFKK